MNIIPLVLALVFMLTLLTIEKLEKYKNQAIIQQQYRVFLEMSEGQEFNLRQRRLFKDFDAEIKQISFRYLIDKTAREKMPHVAGQYKMLSIELMKLLYGQARFFKELQDKRPSFIEELVEAIQQSADAAPKKSIHRIEDICRLDLKDQELQEAFYHMLKGTVTREQYKEMAKNNPLANREQHYISLFSFINFNGKKGAAVIKIERAPREILKVLFVHDDVVDALIARRSELSQSDDNGGGKTLENEFVGKRREGIEDTLLDFSLSKKDKKGRYD